MSPEHIAYAAMVGLSRTGEANAEELIRARATLGIDPGQADPAAVEPTHEPATAPMAQPAAPGATAVPLAPRHPRKPAAEGPPPKSAAQRAREAGAQPRPTNDEPVRRQQWCQIRSVSRKNRKGT